jgi:hypothetical protein
MYCIVVENPEILDVSKYTEEEEEIISNDVGENTDENKFDEMIGVLQDILIDEDFVSMQTDFCLKNCGIHMLYACIFNLY